MRRSAFFKLFPPVLILTAAIVWGTVGFRLPARLSTPPPTLPAILDPAPVLSTPSPTAAEPALTPTPTPTASPSRPVEVTPPALILSPAPTSTPTPAFPAEHYIFNITGHRQYFSLGCEAATAKDWANYFGKDFNEFEFQYKLPLSDNPDLGFVGDVNAPWGQIPPYGYGVHAGPIADLLNVYGIPAAAHKSYTLEQIKAKVAANTPVIAWVIGNVVGGVPHEYTDSQGNTTIVAAYEHVVIVTGYSQTHVRYMSNGKFYDTPVDIFLNSWGVLGNMVVVDE